MKIKKGLYVAKAYVPHMYKIHENEKKQLPQHMVTIMIVMWEWHTARVASQIMAKSEFFIYQIQNGNGFKIMASKWLYSWTALRQICFYQPKIVSIFKEIEKKDIYWPPRGKTHDTQHMALQDIF